MKTKISLLLLIFISFILFLYQREQIRSLEVQISEFENFERVNIEYANKGNEIAQGYYDLFLQCNENFSKDLRGELTDEELELFLPSYLTKSEELEQTFKDFEEVKERRENTLNSIKELDIIKLNQSSQ